ncbi:hypothetical protein FRC08_016947 [Ceratobasidium sp. 394]|nr:hypothetical protein FRC08_016947 [Ceratobasidium sp. 394]
MWCTIDFIMARTVLWRFVCSRCVWYRRGNRRWVVKNVGWTYYGISLALPTGPDSRPQSRSNIEKTVYPASCLTVSISGLAEMKTNRKTSLRVNPGWADRDHMVGCISKTSTAAHVKDNPSMEM